MTKDEFVQAPRSRAHVQDRRELRRRAQPGLPEARPRRRRPARGWRRPAERPSDEKVVDGDRQRWEAWFSILDRWGARERKHAETAAYLDAGARRSRLVGAVDHRLVPARSRAAAQAPAGGRVHDVRLEDGRRAGRRRCSTRS